VEECLKSYRDSHVGEGTGSRYDAMHAGKVDSLIWDYFVKDHLTDAFRRCQALGKTRYLDFACGTGRVLKLGSAFFADSVGIDISADMLAIAQERVPRATLHCLDVTRSAALADEFFDCVTLFRFILNAEPTLRREVLQWLASHMRPGALLIGNNHMETLSFSGVLTLTARTLWGSQRNHLSRQATEKMLHEAGFEVEEWHGYRVLPSLMGRPVLGRSLQLRAERLAQSLGLGRCGVEQVFIARRH
jgi:SAM-dependent methyltransferase